MEKDDAVSPGSSYEKEKVVDALQEPSRQLEASTREAVTVIPQPRVSSICWQRSGQQRILTSDESLEGFRGGQVIREIALAKKLPQPVN